MSFKRNILGWERAVRAALGIGLLAVVWIMPLTGLVGWVVRQPSSPRRCAPAERWRTPC